jgi:hypothetical protein
VTLSDKIGAKFCAHIWIHDIRHSGSLQSNGEPEDWAINDVRGAIVEMEQMTFLTTNWENIRLEEGHRQLAKIQQALVGDIRRGLIFEQLMSQSTEEIWSIIDEIIEYASEWLEERMLYKQSERGRMRVVGWKTKQVQRDLDKLRQDLSKTHAGQRVLVTLRQLFEDQKAALQPLLDQIAQEDVPPEARKQVELDLEKVYLSFRKRFQECFDNVGQLNVAVGKRALEFYFRDIPGVTTVSRFLFHYQILAEARELEAQKSLQNLLMQAVHNFFDLSNQLVKIQ